MKLVCIFLLQILLLIALQATSAYSNFMDNLVTFFKAASSNHSAFDFKKLIHNSEENEQLDAKREAMKDNLIDTGKHDDKSIHATKNEDIITINNTNTILYQMPKDRDSKLIKNSSNLLPEALGENNRTKDRKSKEIVNDTNPSLLQLPKDSVSETTKNSLDTLKSFEDKSNHTRTFKSDDTVNNTNPILLQLSNNSDSKINNTNLLTSQASENQINHIIEGKHRILLLLPRFSNIINNNSTVTLQTSEDISNYTIKDKGKDSNYSNLMPLNVSDVNSSNGSSVTPLKNDSKDSDEEEIDEVYEEDKELNIATQMSVMDRARWNMMQADSLRRRRKNDYIEKVSSESSSRDLDDWKGEFNRLYLHKKFEALNQTRPTGDKVNMVAARPWGAQCGDPNQHGMPWGNCMLAIECEAEYRIYRGDYFCGRSQFVCCALQISSYNMYQGFDVSFEHDSYATGSDEKKGNVDSGEKEKKKKLADKRKRQKMREKNKIKIRKKIKRIIKEIRKILNKQMSNRTTAIKKKTLKVKKFVKYLKKQFKNDRKAVQKIHDRELKEIDERILNTMGKIKVVNEDFMRNKTFRDIVVNGTITKEGARMLMQAYPELDEYMEARRRSRRRMNRKPSEEDLLYKLQENYDY